MGWESRKKKEGDQVALAIKRSQDDQVRQPADDVDDAGGGSSGSSKVWWERKLLLALGAVCGQGSARGSFPAFPILDHRCGR